MSRVFRKTERKKANSIARDEGRRQEETEDAEEMKDQSNIKARREVKWKFKSLLETS